MNNQLIITILFSLLFLSTGFIIIFSLLDLKRTSKEREEYKKKKEEIQKKLAEEKAVYLGNKVKKVVSYFFLAIFIWFILSFVLQTWLSIGETIGVLAVLGVIFFLLKRLKKIKILYLVFHPNFVFNMPSILMVFCLILLYFGCRF